MEVEEAIVVHTENGENASEPAYIPTEAEKISGDVAIDALPYIDTEVCRLKYLCLFVILPMHVHMIDSIMTLPPKRG